MGTSRDILKTRERRGGSPYRRREGREVRRERYGGLSQFRPLLFVFGSARANQTTGDQNSIPFPISLFWLTPLL